jgi:peptide/nickel transport system permease protein
MIRFVLTRLGLSLFSLAAVSLLVFWAIDALPGDAAQRMLGQDATPEALAALRQRLRLDEPALAQYLHWIGGLLQGDLGRSMSSNRPVADLVSGRAASTLLLAAYALVLYLPSSLALGIACAVFRDRAADRLISIAVLLGMCVPEFITGILLVAVFAIGLGWFPPLALIDQATGPGDLLHILFLPALTLTIFITAYAVRLMRETLVETLQSPHVGAARLRGLAPWRVLLHHALPGALGPVLNVTALNIAWLIGSVVVVESVFNFPGIGRLLIDAISFKDVPVIQATVLLLTAIYILCNLAADLAVAMLDPRLRTAR